MDRKSRRHELPSPPPHYKLPGSEASHNAYLGECWCQRTSADDAWPCYAARNVQEPGVPMT